MKLSVVFLGAIRAVVVLFAAVSAQAGTIHIDRFGEPGVRPLVFIAGLASSATLWEPWAEKFGSTHDVHLVGVRGFAELPAEGPLTIGAIAQDLSEYLLETDLSDVVVVGHSVGGMIAMQTANQSDRIGELVLVDSVPFTAGLFVPGITPDAATSMAESLRAGLQSTPEEAFRAQQRAGLGVYTKTSDFLPTLVAWSDSSDVGSVTDIYTELFATDYRDALATIDIPIHLIAAWDASMNVPREQVADIFGAQYSAHDQVQLSVIDDSLHFVMIDQPGAFERVIAKILGGSQ